VPPVSALALGYDVRDHHIARITLRDNTFKPPAIICARSCGGGRQTRPVTIWTAIATALEHKLATFNITNVEFFLSRWSPKRERTVLKNGSLSKKSKITGMLPVYIIRLTLEVHLLPAVLNFSPMYPEDYPKAEEQTEIQYGTKPRCYEVLDVSTFLQALQLDTYLDVAAELQLRVDAPDAKGVEEACEDGTQMLSDLNSNTNSNTNSNQTSDIEAIEGVRISISVTSHPATTMINRRTARGDMILNING
jgi:hypothetical protein